MDKNELFLNWIKKTPNEEDIVGFIKFSNNTFGTNLTYKNVYILKNPIDKIMYGIPTKDDCLNWLEDQSDEIILSVAENLNNYFLFPIWDDHQQDTIPQIILEIEDFNFITVELLKTAITNSLNNNLKPCEEGSKPALSLVPSLH